MIPTHNRRVVLLRALQSLREMEIPPQLVDECEIVIVANACTDDTVAEIARVAPTMPCPMRCMEEPTIGVEVARNRALAEARGEILAFLDDDVWVDKSWLVGLLDVFESQPADLVAGAVNLWWETVQRPEWMYNRSEHLLSCVNYGSEVIELLTPGQAVGANLAIRRRVVEKIGGFLPGLGRWGNVPYGGEETELLRRALDAGFRMFYAPKAVLKHWVAPRQVTIEYLGAAAFGNGLARAFLWKDCSTMTALRVMVEHGFRVVVYLGMEPFLHMSGLKKACIHIRIRRETSLGNILGVWRRWRRLAPVGARNQGLEPIPVGRLRGR